MNFSITLLGATTLALSLSGCDRPSPEPVSTESRFVAAARADEAWREVVRGTRCMQLVSAVVKAKRGPLRERVAELGLADVHIGLRARWQNRVKRAARTGGVSDDAVARQQGHTTIEFSNEAMLEARATDTAECVAAVS